MLSLCTAANESGYDSDGRVEVAWPDESYSDVADVAEEPMLNDGVNFDLDERRDKNDDVDDDQPVDEVQEHSDDDQDGGEQHLSLSLRCGDLALLRQSLQHSSLVELHAGASRNGMSGIMEESPTTSAQPTDRTDVMSASIRERQTVDAADAAVTVLRSIALDATTSVSAISDSSSTSQPVRTSQDAQFVQAGTCNHNNTSHEAPTQ